jgi:hypothetical protein
MAFDWWDVSRATRGRHDGMGGVVVASENMFKMYLYREMKSMLKFFQSRGIRSWSMSHWGHDERMRFAGNV